MNCLDTDARLKIECVSSGLPRSRSARPKACAWLKAPSWTTPTVQPGSPGFTNAEMTPAIALSSGVSAARLAAVASDSDKNSQDAAGQWVHACSAVRQDSHFHSNCYV